MSHLSYAYHTCSTLTLAKANNCYVFPGIGMGCAASAATDVTPRMLLAAARAVAGACRCGKH
eukprot:232519-Chlamydomonas_euryale.AAC.1